MKAFILTAFLVCICGESIADQNEDAEAVRLAYPESKVIYTTSGDLNADGQPDIAAIIRLHSAQSALDKIVILRATSKGYEVLGSSGDLWFGINQPSLQITRGSLFFGQTGNTCCLAGWQYYQFKYRDGRFQLIGVRIGEAQLGESNSAAINDGTVRSVELNLLTGERIENREVGGRKKQFKKSRATPPATIILANWSESHPLDQELAKILSYTIK